MSDTPEDGLEPRPVSAAHRAGGSPARAARTREPGRPASGAKAAPQAPARERIGIRELRQHASVYVDLAEQGYTVDITNRGRLVARLVPVRELGSPLERLIAAGIVEAAEEPGGVGDIEPYPASPAGSAAGESAAGESAARESAAGGQGRIRRQGGR